MSVSESIAIDVNIPPKAAGGGWKQSVDPRKLGTALSVGDTQTASALLTSAGTDIDSDILFWDYVADPADGLPACTCVHYAAAKGNVSVVAWLAGQGAHPGLKDALGRTPMDVACSDEVREELQRALGAYTAVKRNLTSTSSPGKEGRFVSPVSHRLSIMFIFHV